MIFEPIWNTGWQSIEKKHIWMPPPRATFLIVWDPTDFQLLFVSFFILPFDFSHPRPQLGPPELGSENWNKNYKKKQNRKYTQNSIFTPRIWVGQPHFPSHFPLFLLGLMERGFFGRLKKKPEKALQTPWNLGPNLKLKNLNLKKTLKRPL